MIDFDIQNLYSLIEVFSVFNVAFIVSSDGVPKFHTLLYNLAGNDVSKPRELNASTYDSDHKVVILNSYNEYRKSFEKIKVEFDNKSSQIKNGSNDFSNCCLIAFFSGIFYFVFVGSISPIMETTLLTIPFSLISSITQITFFIHDINNKEPWVSKKWILIICFIILVLSIVSLRIYSYFNLNFLTTYNSWCYIPVSLSCIFPTLTYGVRGIVLFEKLKSNIKIQLTTIEQKLDNNINTVSKFDTLIKAGMKDIDNLDDIDFTNK